MTRLSDLRKTADAAIGADGLDSAQVTTIATNAGIAVYTALDSLPSSGLTSGDQAWVESSGRLYISNGSGWYNIALVNASPTLTLDQSGTILMGNTNPLTVTVTASATDADDNQNIISFSVESDGNMVGTGTTVSQDSSVFTITAQSEDSGGTAGDFTLTFKATDQIAVDNEALSFSLAFSNAIDSSSATLMLMKAAGNSVGNASIKYIDSDDSESTWTTTGTVSAGTLSPYRSGGYSAYFDGTGDYLSADLGANIGDGDFTVECYVYIDPNRSTASRGIFQISNTSGGLQANATTNLTVAYRNSTHSYNWVVYANSAQTNTSTASLTGQWQHVALVRSGSSTKLYIDGTSIQTISDSMNYNATRYVCIGGYYNTSYLFDGYIRDFRVVKGTAVYTSDFAVPTSSLTAITNTELLAAHLPYWGDGSTNDLTITANGDPTTQPFGPYDYEPYSGDNHGGSIFFNGEGNYLSHTVPSEVQTLGRQNQSMTLEAWIRPIGAPTNYAFIYGVGNHSSTSGNNLYGLEIGTTYQLRGAVNGAYSTASGMPQTSNNVIKPNVWSHVALVQNAGNWVIYVNGKSEATQGNTSYMSGTTHTSGWVGRSHYDDNRYWPGYVSNLRIHDTAIYTSAFTPPTSPVTSPKLLLNKDGTNSNIFDEAASHNFALVGNTTTSTSQRKFSTSSSIYFDGTNDAIEFDNFPLDGDLTIEGWFYQAVATDNNYRMIMSAETYGGSAPLAIYTRNAQLQGWANSSSASFVASSFSANTWHHCAVVRNNGTWKIYLDGTGGQTTTVNGTYAFGPTTDWRFGAWTNLAYDWNGYLQDWRISNIARYTANFTPPTTEFEL